MEGLSETDLAKRMLARQIVIESARVNMDSRVMLKSLIKEMEELPSQDWQRERIRRERLEAILNCLCTILVAPLMVYIALIVVVFLFGTLSVGLLSGTTNKTRVEELSEFISICVPVKMLEFPLVRLFGAPQNYLFSQYVCVFKD
jgi:hypothetical protein